MKDIDIEIGPMSKSLIDQLSGILPKKDSGVFEHDRKMICRMLIRGYIGQQQYRAAGLKLLKRISVAIRKGVAK